MPSRRAAGLLLSSFLLLAAPACQAAVSEAAARLRNVGLAQLENEQPAEAEATFRRLAAAEPRDPLPWANLAVAHLRQQETAEALAAANRAARLAPRRGDVLAIQAEALAAAGRTADAVAVLRRAITAAPDDVEIVHQLYRTAAELPAEAAEAARGEALARLERLRPENAVVLLERARRALEAGERAAASAALLRLRELVWQAPQAEPLLAAAVEQLAGGDARAALLATRRLENVLRVSPMVQAGLRELATGVVGVPVVRFAGEPPPSDFGPPVKVELAGSRLDGRPTVGAALAVADLDGDRRPDLARLVPGASADAAPRLEVRLAARDWRPEPSRPAPGLGRGEGLPRLIAADLDNDGHRDLLAHGPAGVRVWLGSGDGGLTAAADGFGIAGGATAAAVLDHDLEGDLDVLLADSRRLRLHRNALQGPLAAAPQAALPGLPGGGAPAALIVSDLDRDGDPDLAVATPERLAWADNLRQGGFADASRPSGLARVGGG
ncbi:MAG TPA: VCBS repeat-containing protein, partial [Thermoanaerobaculia bacterium]|nr:VCBS repeat-containing protein [Thermoanaerobaculia bacterium]